MNTQEQVMPEKEPGVLIAKVHFDVLGIDPKEKFGQHIVNEGNFQYDFNFKDLDEAKSFYCDVVREATNINTFDTKAVAEIGNEILRQM